jgi:hypothetical protein
MVHSGGMVLPQVLFLPQDFIQYTALHLVILWFWAPLGYGTSPDISLFSRNTGQEV